jgi:hypothetical protein
MRDPINPFRDEIHEWAYNPIAEEPVQDWDLHLAHLRDHDLFIELAADHACPNQDYFLRLLYLIIGDAVRTDYSTETRDTIEALLDQTHAYPRHAFHLLRQRSRELVANPKLFDYNLWCAGQWVTQDLAGEGH